MYLYINVLILYLTIAVKIRYITTKSYQISDIMDDEKKLKMGIPTGSLVKEKRSDLAKKLESAGIKIDEPSDDKPLEVSNIGWLEAVRGRPQEFPAIAAVKRTVDVFFCGDDWAREWELDGLYSKKLVGLDTGKVDIVVANKVGRSSDQPMVAVSEYTKIARDYISREYGIKPEDIPILSIKDPIPKDKPAVVIKSEGATEAKVYYGIADLAIEATQSGSTLEAYSLEISRTLLNSECSFYAAARLQEDKWKMKKAQRIADMLQAVCNAEDRDLVSFNVHEKDLDTVLKYIRNNRLFGDQETVVNNGGFSQVTIQVDRNNPQKPYIDIIGELRELGASSIDGIPLLYSLK